MPSSAQTPNQLGAELALAYLPTQPRPPTDPQRKVVKRLEITKILSPNPNFYLVRSYFCLGQYINIGLILPDFFNQPSFLVLKTGNNGIIQTENGIIPPTLSSNKKKLPSQNVSNMQKFIWVRF